jgi:putative membrane protein
LTVRSQFTDQELEAIRSATREAETKTGGELVCVIVNRCDSYLAPIWQAAALGSVGGAAAAGIAYASLDSWVLNPFLWILMPALIGAALGLLTLWLVPPARRWLTPAPVLARRVDRRAAVAFLDEEIFNTRDRTGVLLFVALFEHQIRILPDRGIERSVPEESWQRIASRLTRALRGGRRGEAIVEAIHRCGDLLVDHGVDRRQDDENELADEPRLLNE